MKDQLYQRIGSYHDQKENISYIFLAFEISLLTFIFSLDQWFPCKLMIFFKSHNILKIIFYSLYILLLILIHVFFRNQLRLKRWAAIRFKIIEIALLNNYQIELNEKIHYQKWWHLLIDLFIPYTKNVIKSDIELKYYPEDLKKLLEEKELNKTNSYLNELLLSLFSIITLLIIGVYSFI